VGLTAANEDRRCAVTVTSSTAPLLVTQLLAGASNVGTLARGASDTAAIFQLPSDYAVENVSARFETEHGIRELHLALGG
jgi:hypothetical protein